MSIPSMGEVKADNIIKQISNVGIKKVYTVFEELDLEAFHINYPASAYNFNCSLDVSTRRGDEVRGFIDDNMGEHKMEIKVWEEGAISGKRLHCNIFEEWQRAA